MKKIKLIYNDKKQLLLDFLNTYAKNDIKTFEYVTNYDFKSNTIFFIACFKGKQICSFVILEKTDLYKFKLSNLIMPKSLVSCKEYSYFLNKIIKKLNGEITIIEEKKNNNDINAIKNILSKYEIINKAENETTFSYSIKHIIDSRSLSEKLEDGMDEIVMGTQELFYGKGDNFTEDIPAMMEHPSGIKRINKVQTRRNLNKRLFKNKTLVKIILLIFLIPIIISIFYFVIGKLI